MSQETVNNQEIDLLNLLNILITSFKKFLNKTVRICIKHYLKFIILIIIGYLLGSVLSSNFKTYESKIIVQPNFNSVDYMYDKVELIGSKLKSRDTLFFSKMGFKNFEDISDIKIEPIIDVYNFVKNEDDKNFDMLKLQAEDGSISKIIEDPNTSKYYNNHVISIISKKQINTSLYTDILLKYLNDSQYFSKIKNQYTEDLITKNKSYGMMLIQIDHILNKFSNLGESKSEKLVYYNDNTQLNDVLNTKTDLIAKIANNNIILLQSDKVIKDISTNLNTIYKKNILNKSKIVLPILMCLLFFIFIYKQEKTN